MGLLRDFHKKFGGPRWIYIFYAIGYLFLFTLATLILTGRIEV